MRTLMVTLGVVALSVTATGCATKKYVNTRVAEVNDAVTTVSNGLGEAQAVTQKHQARLVEVERDVQRAQTRAEAAEATATRANSAAAAVTARVDESEAASRRLVMEVVLTDDQAKFAFGRATLSAEARMALDHLVQQLREANRRVWVEIEGHTDATGPAAFNEALGLERAESVRAYLHEQHQVPLHKINVVSYGESRPVASNATRAGRAQNRRVTVRVVG